MNRKIAFDKLGGLYVHQDTLDFLQVAYSQSLDGLAAGMGNKIVITGLENVGGSVNDGIVSINGELLPFVGGNVLTYCFVESLVTKEQFDDGNLKDTYTVKRVRFAAIATAETFLYTELQRLPLNQSTVFDSLIKYHQAIKAMVNFEPEVILSGCIVTAVDTGASTCAISAGTVMFNGQIINTPAYVGSYPAYLSDAAQWATAVPGAGLYISFDPFTSQYYKNVLDRALTPEGRIIMMETLTDRFDNTFVGRWEMKGYRLMAEMQSRVPVGLWFDGIAVANVTDAAHVTAENIGGEKTHILSTGEMPAHTHGSFNGETGGAAAGNGDANGGTVTVGNNHPHNTASAGGGQAHNNMQPFLITVYAKRTA